MNTTSSRLAKALAVGAASLALGVVGVSGQEKSVNDGVYTDVQAGRGAKTFESRCTTCHDTGRFTGADFLKQWSGQPVHALYDVMKTTMPEDNIGGLSDDDYTRVITYILKLNGFPAGKDPLPSDSTFMRGIRIGPVADAAKSQGR